MIIDLKKDIDILIYDMCDAMEPAFGNGKTLIRDEVKLDLVLYLSYLFAVHGTVTWQGVNFINEHLDTYLSEEDVLGFIDDYIIEWINGQKVISSKFENTLPKTLDLFLYVDIKVAKDNNGNVEAGTIITVYHNVFRMLSQEFMTYIYASDIVRQKAINYLTMMLNHHQDVILSGIVPEPKGDFLRDTSIRNDSSNGTNIKNNFSDEPEIKESLEELLTQLKNLVGLNAVKEDVVSLINLLKVNKIRQERGMQQMPMSLHLVFSGNPGTGKTTVARLLAKIYYRLGVLSKGHLVEVDRSGLVAGYVGQTALKVQEVIQKSIGGVLFIDEAYSLTSNKGENDYGKEAIDTLLKGMEDNRKDLIVIVAGYPDLMNDFLNSNPGLRSRFNRFINFADYTPQELLHIFKNLCDSSGYTANKECIECVKEYFERHCIRKDVNFANGRDVRNYFEKAVVNQANRLAKTSNVSNNLLSEFTIADIQNITI